MRSFRIKKTVLADWTDGQQRLQAVICVSEEV